MPHFEKGRDPNWPNIPDDIIDIINRDGHPVKVENTHFSPRRRSENAVWWIMGICTPILVFVTLGRAYHSGDLLIAIIIFAILSGFFYWIERRGE